MRSYRSIRSCRNRVPRTHSADKTFPVRSHEAGLVVTSFSELAANRNGRFRAEMVSALRPCWRLSGACRTGPALWWIHSRSAFSKRDPTALERDVLARERAAQDRNAACRSTASRLDLLSDVYQRRRFSSGCLSCSRDRLPGRDLRTPSAVATNQPGNAIDPLGSSSDVGRLPARPATLRCVRRGRAVTHRHRRRGACVDVAVTMADAWFFGGQVLSGGHHSFTFDRS